MGTRALTLLEMGVLFFVGLVAAVFGAVVGGGGLIVFPALLSFGYSPIDANVTDTMGGLPGCLSAAWAGRSELRNQWRRVTRFGAASACGAAIGAPLLFVLPKQSFKSVAPILILLSCFLIVVQPQLSSWLERRRPEVPRTGAVMFAALFVTGVYGGYFGVAQGLILMAILSVHLGDDLQRVNANKNALVALTNSVAGAVFILVGPIAWGPALAVGLGSVVGGILGARVGRRLPSAAYRVVIVTVGVFAAARVTLG